jgi:hypothetical protein
MDTPDYIPDPVSKIGSLAGLTVEQGINTLKLLEARTRAETADYEKRLVMQQFRPCKVYPVVIYHDGMRWVCSYGAMGQAYSEFLPDNAMGQSGVEAYGEFPEEAMQNFDSMWVGMLAENIADAAEEDEDDE